MRTRAGRQTPSKGIVEIMEMVAMVRVGDTWEFGSLLGEVHEQGIREARRFEIRPDLSVV